MKDHLIIFGAGKSAVEQYEWALLFGYHILFFVDNDSSKWGKIIEGLRVYSPGILKEYKCTVTYPDRYQDEISRQLVEMQYQGNKISFTMLKKIAVCEKYENISFLPEKEPDEKISFLLDAYFSGMNWGGVESWSCIVGNQLSRLGIRTQILCGMNKKFDEFADHCIHFPKENELSMIKKMVGEIVGFLPCIFLSHGSAALYAAQLVKSIFPEHIQIVFVAHGDIKETYEKIEFWSDRVDKIICISEKIKDRFQKEYKVKKELLVYRPNSIPISKIYREREIPGGTLKIGYAARLRKEQKRVHLLPDIIEACLKRNLNVEFSIAGEGECQELLLNYVKDRHLEDRVHILGWIPPTEMAEFWGKQDVYLNISDFEGMSLAMLEAMAYGAVPVTTDVSGVSDLINDGENGFVIPIWDWPECADKIEILDKDRGLVKKISDYNMELMKEKCDISDYVKWIIETFHF